jgi:hypothetical protein
MDKMLSLEFMYKSKTYYALVRTKLIGQEKQYYITVMNGELEMLLYGNHVILEDGDGLRSATDIQQPEVLQLKNCITDALCKYMQENNLSGVKNNFAVAEIHQ